MNKSLLEAIATLIGTTIGAGILGLPYVVANSGFIIGLMLILIIGFSILFINLALGEIVLRTNGNHQLTGYAFIYHGKLGKFILTLVMIFGIYGALTAYLIGEGNTLSYIFNGNPLLFTIIFSILTSLIILFGISGVKKSELILSTISLTLIILIILLSLNFIKFNNISYFNIENILIPYGAIFFAFLALPAIPEMKEEISKNKKLLKKAIIIGSLIPFIIYILFVLAIVGVTGINTTEIATFGLGSFIGKYMLFLGSLFATFAMTTAFLSLALALKEMYIYDFKINKYLSWLLTCFVPLILILFGVNDFIKVISIVGSVVAGIDGIFIISMWYKAKIYGKRNPEYSVDIPKIVVIVIAIVFIVALITTLFDLRRIFI